MVTTGRAAATIVYPDSDGFPLPDGRFQEPLYLRAVGTLRTFFKDTPNCEVSGNTFIYYEEDNPRLKLAPDCQVVFGLTDEAAESLRHRNTYLTWEVGKPPDFVLEIASPSTAYVDQHRKRDLYEGMGVPEYWRYDSLGGRLYDEPLVGERLVGGEYERMEMRREPDGSVWGHSDALNLDLWWIDGELRFWDPMQGAWLRNFEETEEALQAAEARAGSERDARLAEAVRADAERDARLDAEARAEEEYARRLDKRERWQEERERRLAADARAAEADARAVRLEAELRRLRGE